MMCRRKNLAWILFALAACSAGCQQTVVTPPSARPVVITSAGPGGQVVSGSSSGQPFSGSAITAIDPCADRLQDLCGALTVYYSVNHRGPAKVEELQQYADNDQVLKFTCPVSAKPYLCAPKGLESPGQSMRIYVYDAEPSHGGARWCAVTKSVPMPKQPVVFFVEKIPEAKFRLFLNTPILIDPTP